MADNIVDLQCPLCGKDAPAGIAKCACGYAFANGGESGTAVEWSPDTATASGLGDSWRSAGWGLISIGAIGCAIGIFMSSSIDSGYGGGDIVNLDLMFQKGIAIAGGLFGVGLGTFCVGIGAILDALGRKP